METNKIRIVDKIDTNYAVQLSSIPLDSNPSVRDGYNKFGSIQSVNNEGIVP